MYLEPHGAAGELIVTLSDGSTASIGAIVYATTIAALGVLGFAAGLAGFLFNNLSPAARGSVIAAAALLLVPGQGIELYGTRILVLDLAGIVLLSVVAVTSWKSRG